MSGVRVRLVDVPVALFCAADTHTHDLLREVALMAAARAEAASDRPFADLLATAEAYAHPAAVHRRVASRVCTARDDGHEYVDVELVADVAAADAAQAWDDVASRFDALSRDERLLTMPAAAEVVAFRRWYVRELVEQVRTGRAPVSWFRARESTLAGAAR